MFTLRTRLLIASLLLVALLATMGMVLFLASTRHAPDRQALPQLQR